MSALYDRMLKLCQDFAEAYIDDVIVFSDMLNACGPCLKIIMCFQPSCRLFLLIPDHIRRDLADLGQCENYEDSYELWCFISGWCQDFPKQWHPFTSWPPLIEGEENVVTDFSSRIQGNDKDLFVDSTTSTANNLSRNNNLKRQTQCYPNNNQR